MTIGKMILRLLLVIFFVALGIPVASGQVGLVPHVTLASGNLGAGNAVAVDSNGNLHISYYDYDNRDLRYLEIPPVACDFTPPPNCSVSISPEIVDSLPTSFFFQGALHTAIAVDSRGTPHISYQNGTQTLKYATKAGSGWTTETVAPSGLGYYNSIAVDSNGAPHISYSNGGYVSYATKSGGTWVNELVDTGDRGTSIALDSNGSPHIAYDQHAFSNPSSTP